MNFQETKKAFGTESKLSHNYTDLIYGQNTGINLCNGKKYLKNELICHELDIIWTMNILNLQLNCLELLMLLCKMWFLLSKWKPSLTIFTYHVI